MPLQIFLIIHPFHNVHLTILNNRKVASVSGDCRRALDICRRATEIAEENSTRARTKIEINFGHITQALNEMFASPKVRAIKNCTKFEKLFLQAVSSEITRTGVEEVEFQRVYWQIGTLAPVLGIKYPPAEGLLWFNYFLKFKRKAKTDRQEKFHF